MEQPPMPASIDPVNSDKSIKVEKISDILEHIGESFESEKIHISEENIRDFLKSINEGNKIHFDKNRVHESVLATKESGDNIVSPGFYTLSLSSHEEAIHDALIVAEPHEISIKEAEHIKWLRTVFAGDDIMFNFSIKNAVNNKIKDRNSVDVIWQVEGFKVIGDRKKACISFEFQLAYTSLDSSK